MSIAMQTKRGKQVLLFLSEWYKPGSVMAAKPVPLPPEGKPSCLWTLCDNDPRCVPDLPFHPHHNVNAFLEDFIHDWNIRCGELIYRSRVAHGPTWILLEYDR